MLKETLIKKAIAFEADLTGITKIQKRFLKEGKEFVYFRKGEFDNAWEILVALSVILTIITSSIVLAPYIKKGKKFAREYLKQGINQWLKHRPRKKADYVQVISIRTEDNKNELIMFKLMGVEVCVIRKTKCERLRFFVNEKGYCIFFRRREDSFFGVMGNDTKTIERLKHFFEQEFSENKK